MADLIHGIEPLIERYGGFLLDQFGVLHDGERPLKGVLDALRLLRAADKRVVVVSNSGKRSGPNEARLARIGIPRELYAAMVSSGETAWLGLRSGEDATFAGLGRRCLLITRGGDRSAIEGLDLELAPDAEAASFVLLSGLDADDAARARCAHALARAAQRGLTLLCTNPDLVSIEGERHVDGPGAFAARYAAAGGEVRYIGKPWPAIYRAALATVGLPPAQVVAIGDSLEHDIGGAARFGIDGALVTGGVHRDVFAQARTPNEFARALDGLARDTPRPRWLLETFRPTPAPGG